VWWTVGVCRVCLAGPQLSAGLPVPGVGYRTGVKGDWVEIVVDTGDGTRVYEIAATRAGRRVEIATGRGVVEVSEVTRSGTPVRSARFMSTRVIALVEHPAAEQDDHSRGGQADA
jgi:hypothetical protein